MPPLMSHGAMSPIAGQGEASRSASAIVANTTRGYHLLKIDGYSHSKATPTGEPLVSCRFTVGGHHWRIYYYPNGNVLEASDYISIFLILDEVVVKDVRAQFQICFAGQVARQPSLTWKTVRPFSNRSCYIWGYSRFMKRENFEKLEDLKDDSFTLRCDIIVVDKYRAEEASASAFISVPPSNLHRQLGDLLKNEKGTDVVFEVAGEKFRAHRCVLAARSPVFSAELFGLMMESDIANGVIHIDDMEAHVFKALLHFVYMDSLPEMEVEEYTMCQHLLVAADRYHLERLKLVCEERLCKHIGVGTAADILTLSDQYHCDGLKKACFDFLWSPANLRAFVDGEGFEYLRGSCPSLMKELVAILGTSHNHAQ